MQHETQQISDPARRVGDRTTVVVRGRAPGGENVNEVIELSGVTFRPGEPMEQTPHGELRIGNASVQLPGVYPRRRGKVAGAARTIGGFLLRFGFGAIIFYLTHALYDTTTGTVPRPLTYIVAVIAIAAGVREILKLRQGTSWKLEATAIFFLVAGLARFDDLVPGPLHSLAIAGFAAGWVQLRAEYGEESAFDRIPFQVVETREEVAEDGVSRHTIVTLSNPPDRWTG